MRKLYLALVSMLYIATATAQDTTPLPLSLQDCMDYAMKHNYTIKNSQLDVLIQKAQTGQTLSAALPHVNGKADFNYFPVAQRSFIDAHALDPAAPAGYIEAFPFSLTYGSDASVTASQVLFDGQVFIAIKARNTLLEFAKLNGAVTEENVRYNVYRSYNSLVIAYRQYAVIKSSLIYARSLEHDITATQQNGFAEKIDVERTSVQVNNLATDSVRVSNLLTVSEQMLKYQIGMDINTPIVLTDTSVETRSQNVLALLEENEQYERVPEYNVATTGLKLNEFNLKRYQLAAYPSLNVFFSQGENYGSNKFSDLLVFNRYYAFSTFGATLNMPIFNGFMRKNQVDEARLNVEKSKNNIIYEKQTIDYQAASSRTSLRNAVLQVKSQHRNLDLAMDVLDLAQRKYKAGVGSNLEVNQAQTDQLTAQTNYFSALLDLINAEADLKKALGLLK
jgi:outer membrane protein TolC